MRIKLLENCKKGTKGEVLEMRNYFANLLIKKGLAKEVEETFRIGDLCFGEIAYVQDIEIDEIKRGEVSDISFWATPVSIGIFKYEKPQFFKSILMENDYYSLIASKRKFLSTKGFNNHKIRIGDYIVNSSSVRDMKHIEQDILSLGWTLDSELDKYEIYDLEKYLTKKYCIYKDMTLFLR